MMDILIENSSIQLTKEDILNDYFIAQLSREASIMGRREVFMGKAKFGIFGDGKEVPQLAMARVFKKGDFRSGYYRDQTFMFAIGELTVERFFAQLYAHADLEHEPFTGGRLMNVHFATRSLNNDGTWKKLTEQYNSAADVSCTAAQMPRLVGLAYASKLYRQNPDLADMLEFSIQGNEIAFGTIGDAATSEGIFFESINAAGVLQVPLIVSIWDDAYGISVPKKYQTTKEDISVVLEGFKRTDTEDGFDIYRVKGWDYMACCQAYIKAAEICRKHHIPAIIHVLEITQPQGHSTSGSHERYKSKERLEWEKEYDCNKKMREWMLSEGIATEDELIEIEQRAKNRVLQGRNKAWEEYQNWIKQDRDSALFFMDIAINFTKHRDELTKLKDELAKTVFPTRKHDVKMVRKALRILRDEEHDGKAGLEKWLERVGEECYDRYSSHLYSQSKESALNVKEIKPVYSENSPWVDGREVLCACFDAALKRDKRVIAFGEDVGNIGDVNQAFAGLQQKYGVLRVTDTGIRETTIVGQGIGVALRGLRPIAEIQYLDYIYYAIQILADDVSCLHYRTKGGQKCPIIVRTRGHRLEGVWHSGSPISMIINAVRGMYVLVPRNMTQAAGMYNTMLQSDDAAIIIECLNGYRLKERLPDNVGEFTVPLGIPEILREGKDVTLVTYGTMCRIVMEAVKELEEYDIDCEVIDIQTILPFDLKHSIVNSLKKTGRIIFADEDVPGGATAFMMQQVLEVQGGFKYLDSPPATITAKPHRPAYADDGDYFSKPNAEDVFDEVYRMMHETNPKKWPMFKMLKTYKGY
jgi:pyruvate/2-oxoglutarate/acetoin dehydrogenase E1 component/TPP-dependent pyruvate/acetoin dehydrogenase alpha subunit